MNYQPTYYRDKQTVTAPHLGDFDIYITSARKDGDLIWIAATVTDAGPITAISDAEPGEAVEAIKARIMRLDADTHAAEQARLWKWNKGKATK